MKCQVRPTIEHLFDEYRRRGDVNALGEVFDRTAGQVMRLAVHLAPDRAAAEDLVQSTFVSAIESASSYERGRPLMPWLCGVLANHARRERASRARRVEPSRLHSLPVSDPARDVEDRELSAVVAAALDEIKDPYRQVLELYLSHGLNPASIAKVMRRPQGTVRSQLSRGLDSLRKVLPESYATAGAAAIATSWLSSPAAAAMRHVVMEQGVASVTATSVVAGAGIANGIVGSGAGVVVMKKIGLAVAAVVVVSFAAFLSVDSGDSSGAVPHVEPSVRVPIDADRSVGEGPADERISDDSTEERETVSRPDPEPVRIADADAEHGSLRLVAVFRDDGKRAAGVAVRISAGLSSDAHLTARFVTTGADGEVVVTGLGSGHHLVETLDGNERRGAYVAAGDEVVQRIEVERGVTVVGTVVDEAGVAIPDASVWASMSLIPYEGGVAATTDSGGRFRIVGVSKNQLLAAHKASHGPAPMVSVRSMREVEPGMREARLTLANDGALLVGVVVDAEGLRVPRAAVQIRARQGKRHFDAKSGWSSPPPARRVLADARGQFEVDGLAPGLTEIHARARGRAPTELEEKLGAHTRTQIRIVLQRGVRIHGRVTDGGGNPVSHVTVKSGAPHPFKLCSVTTASDGAFDLRGVPAGTVRIEAIGLEKRQAAKTFEVTDGESIEWNPVLKAPSSRTLSGRVVDADGEALVQWGVIARGRSLSPQGATDADGRFHLEGVDEGPYRIEVREPRTWTMPPVHVVEGVVPGVGEDVVITVPANATAKSTIVGRFFDLSGQPVKDGRVSVWPESSHMPIQLKLDPATGEFRRGGLPAGTYRVTCTIRGAGRVSVKRRVAAGETVDLGVLQPVRNGAVAIRATLPDGAVPERGRGIAVLASDAHGKSLATLARTMAVTQMSGASHQIGWIGDAFHGSMPPGKYRIRLWGYNFAPYECEIVVSSGATTQRNIELASATRQSFEFSIPDDVTWLYFMKLKITGAEGVVQEKTLQSLQRQPYKFVAGFLPGQYLLRAEANSGLWAEVEFQVGSAAASTPVQVELRER